MNWVKLKDNDKRGYHYFPDPAGNPGDSFLVTIKHCMLFDEFKSAGVFKKLYILQKVYTSLWLTLFPLFPFIWWALTQVDPVLGKQAYHIMLLTGYAAFWPLVLAGYAWGWGLVKLLTMLGVFSPVMGLYMLVLFISAFVLLRRYHQHIMLELPRIRYPWRVKDL